MARPLTKAELEKHAVTGWEPGENPTQTVSGNFNTEQEARTGIGKRTREQTDDETLIAETEERLNQEALVEERQRRLSQAAILLKTPKASGVGLLAESAAMKAISRSTFFWMCGWHTWQWLSFQLTLSITAIAFLGAATVLQSSWWGQIISRIFSAANAVTSAVGVDFSLLSPMNMFFALHFILLGLLWLSILATICIYIIFQHKALSGKATGLKYGAVLIALIGSALPIANLIPWIFIYIFVMKRYPH